MFPVTGNLPKKTCSPLLRWQPCRLRTSSGVYCSRLDARSHQGLDLTKTMRMLTDFRADGIIVSVHQIGRTIPEFHHTCYESNCTRRHSVGHHCAGQRMPISVEWPILAAFEAGAPAVVPHITEQPGWIHGQHNQQGHPPAVAYARTRHQACLWLFIKSMKRSNR